MNYSKIQEILEHDLRFGPSAVLRDTKVPTRSGEVIYSSLTVKVAEAIGQSSYTEKTCSRATVLAFAQRITKGQPTPCASAILSTNKTETPATIIVRPAPTAEVKPSVEKAQLKAQQADLAQFVTKGDILKFQGAVAIGQLLAAVFQLAESDCWEGHEHRKELLNELLDSYEAVSKRHVNYSVKQILRDKAEEQFRNGS
jgi:hypothetical protein